MIFYYFFPFLYFYNTRLRKSSFVFHIVFEWIAAIVLLLFFGKFDNSQSIVLSIYSYFAFINLYEIGYITNDLFSAKREYNGRIRCLEYIDKKLIFLCIIFRVIFFIIITALADRFYSPEWWSFFLALCIVYFIHNNVVDNSFKIVTFLWLSWIRFMAPIFFVVEESQLFGIGMAAAMEYVVFRLLSYLESKNMLNLPMRKDIKFRTLFFFIPLTGWLIFWSSDHAKGFLVLTAYYAIASIAGLWIYKIKFIFKNYKSLL